MRVLWLPPSFRYKQRATKALELYVASVAPYRGLTATLHIVYCHGHQFLEWAEREVGIPLGALTEGSCECSNKEKKDDRCHHTRKDTIEHSHEDLLNNPMDRYWTKEDQTGGGG